MMAEVKFYWSLLLRRLPVMLAIVILCSALGFVQAMRMPTSFTTEARLLVEAPVIEGEGVANISADEEIQIIREQLMTRPNLLDIAEEHDVFVNYSALAPDTIVQRMRAATNIRSTGGRNQATLITVSFTARSGQIAADIVNEYVTRIISASVDRVRGVADENLEFYEQEVDRLSAELAALSAEISRFQAENADALPGEQGFRLNRQAVLQERIASAQRELSSLIDQRARIIEIYETTGTINASDAALSDDQRQLRNLERELAQQLSTYTETAPQIVMLRRRIEQLREQVAAAAPEGGPVNSSQAVLDLQLGQIDTQIANLEGIVAEAEAELERLQDAIARTPLNAVTLERMQREYENAQGLYDRAADNLQQAQVDLRITETNRGRRITLTESASVPRQPSSPNRQMIALLGGMAGVGLAGGLFLLLEFLNRTVRRPVEIRRALGIEPLATVPYIQTRTERLKRFALRGAYLVLVVVGLPAALWAVDTYYMPLDTLASAVLSRLGLT